MARPPDGLAQNFGSCLANYNCGGSLCLIGSYRSKSATEPHQPSMISLASPVTFRRPDHVARRHRTVGSAARQSAAHSRHMSAQSLQCACSYRPHWAAHRSQMRAQLSSITPTTSILKPERRTAIRPIAVQTSAQSRHDRMHCVISIFSAMQASAHEVHISAQNIAWRAAVAKSGLKSCPTSGWSDIILWMDISHSPACVGSPNLFSLLAIASHDFDLIRQCGRLFWMNRGFLPCHVLIRISCRHRFPC